MEALSSSNAVRYDYHIVVRSGHRAGAFAVLAAVMCALSGCSGSGHPSGDSATTSPARYSRTLIAAGVLLLRQGNSNAAEQLFQQAIRREPSSPAGHYNLGVVYEEQGQSSQALRQYQLAIRANPRFVSALYNEAVVIASRNPQQAISLYHRVIAIQPDSPSAFFNLGLLEVKANDGSQAIKDLRQAVRLYPGLASKIPAPLRAQVRS
jgi:tetratricopeptide (TPR) repeat protein